MRAYSAILRTRSVAVLVAAAMTVRLSPAINQLAILLYIADTSGSFAIAGIATGAFSLGTATGSPMIARLCDRRGIGMLVPFSLLHGVGLTLIWVLGAGGAPEPVVIGMALAAGIAYPPTGSSLRARWPLLITDRDLLTSAYALDSVAASISFLTGPLITALLVATLGPGFALPLAGSAVLIASVVFVLRAPEYEKPEGESSGRLGALAATGIRSLMVFIFAAGFCMGTVEVAVAGFASEIGREALAGLLISLWSVSTAFASFFYGMHVPRWSLRTVIHPAGFALPLASVPIVFAGDPILMAVLLVISGLPYAPLFITTNQLVASVTPFGTETEAYTWIITAMVAGSATGVAVAGLSIERFSWQMAILFGVAIGTLGAAYLQFRRRTLAPTRPDIPYQEPPTPLPGITPS